MFIENINSPADLKGLGIDELKTLAEEEAAALASGKHGRPRHRETGRVRV